MASLLSLPLELIIYISSFIATPDLASLRLTCKQTEKSLYEWFAEEFFAKKQFMLTQPSLQTLIEISKHVGLSKRLKHVIIATNVFDDTANHFRDSEACDRYTQGYADQQALLNYGVDREMLVEAFRNLENLETVDLRDFSARRPRDGTKWSSWGATTVKEETGLTLAFTYRGSHSQHRFVSHIFSNLIYALGKAEKTVPRFEVLLRQKPGGLPDAAFQVPDFVYPTCRPVLENITALFLALDLSHARFNFHDNVGSQAASSPALRRFLGYTRNLTHLRLNFQMYQEQQNTQFIQWLGQPVPASVINSGNDSTSPYAAGDNPPPIGLPFLKELDLGSLRIDKNDLYALLFKFSSNLEALSLWRLTMYQHLAPTRHNLWYDVFKTLQTPQFSKLDRLKAISLEQHQYGKVTLSPGRGSTQSGDMLEASGKELKQFFGNLDNIMPMDWPELPMNFADSADENSDDGDEDDEDEYNDDDDDVDDDADSDDA